jgi:hypothetical protein
LHPLFQADGPVTATELLLILMLVAVPAFFIESAILHLQPITGFPEAPSLMAFVSIMNKGERP